MQPILPSSSRNDYSRQIDIRRESQCRFFFRWSHGYCQSRGNSQIQCFKYFSKSKIKLRIDTPTNRTARSQAGTLRACFWTERCLSLREPKGKCSSQGENLRFGWQEKSEIQKMTIFFLIHFENIFFWMISYGRSK